jgi:hypothetical protein
MKNKLQKKKVTKRKLYSYPLSFKEEVILNTDGHGANSLHKVIENF